MEDLNLIYDNGVGFVIKSAGRELNQHESEYLLSEEWVTQQLDQTAKAALDPNYPALTQVLEYRTALRAYRDNNYEGERPLLDV